MTKQGTDVLFNVALGLLEGIFIGIATTLGYLWMKGSYRGDAAILFSFFTWSVSGALVILGRELADIQRKRRFRLFGHSLMVTGLLLMACFGDPAAWRMLARIMSEGIVIAGPVQDWEGWTILGYFGATLTFLLAYYHILGDRERGLR